MLSSFTFGFQIFDMVFCTFEDPFLISFKCKIIHLTSDTSYQLQLNLSVCVCFVNLQKGSLHGPNGHDDNLGLCVLLKSTHEKRWTHSGLLYLHL